MYAKIKGNLLRPRTVVDYLREPYVYTPGNVRVTFDSDIRSGLFSRDVFDPALPLLPAQDSRRVVMEVKYDAYLPSLIADALQLGERSACAISKYVLARGFE